MQDCDTSHVSPASRLSVLVIPFKPESHSRGMRMPRRSCARRWRALTARIRSQNPKGSASGIPTLLQTARKDGLPANREQKKPAARYSWAAGQPRRLFPHGLATAKNGLGPSVFQFLCRVQERLVELPPSEVVMKDLYEILRQKEMAIERIRKEIAALKFVVPLLGDDGEPRRASESSSSWRKDS